MNKDNDDSYILDDEELRLLKYAAVEFGQYQSKMNQSVIPKIFQKVKKLNDKAKEQQND